MFTNAYVFSLGDRLRRSVVYPLKIGALAVPVAIAAALSVVSTSATGRDVTLTWEPSTTPEIGGYDVHWGPASGDYPHSVDVGITTTYTLDALDPAQTYFIVVTTYDPSGSYESDFSNEVSVIGSGTDGSTSDGSTTDGSTTDGSTTDGSTTDGSSSDGSTTAADTTAPYVTVSSPESGSTVNGSITLSAFATDDVGATEITISADGMVQCAGVSYATCDWHAGKAGAGNHTISATARDAAGNVGTHAVTVAVPQKGGGKGKGNGNRKK